MPKYRIVNQNGEMEPTVDFWLEIYGDCLAVCTRDTEGDEWTLLEISDGEFRLSEGIESPDFVTDSVGRLKVHK